MARTKKRLSLAVTECSPSDDEDGVDAQSPRSEKMRKKDRSDEKNGWIRSIELTDFMCHRHLEVSLNSTINFITGNNGSGKSAILTALTVCLGGRASTTQRASSLASLVREGAESASVRVTIANGGQFNAFRAERYGDSIVVERRFGRLPGVNRYATYNGSTGKMVSDRREEMLQVCDHFGIQVDNPLAVLSQETAKRFLASAKPKELYEFFLKATQLEQLAADHGFSVDRLKTAGQRLAAIKETWRGKEERVAELEGLLKEVRRQKEIRQALQEMKGQLAWRMIGEQEAACESVAADVARGDARLERLEADRSKIVERSAGIQEEIADGQREANALSLELEPVRRQGQAIHDETAGGRKAHGKIQAELRELNGDYQRERKNLERIQLQLQEERSKAPAEEDGSEKIHALAREVSALEAQLASARSEEGRLREEAGSLNGRLRRAREMQKEAREKVDRTRHSLEGMKRAKGDRLMAYHDRLPALLRDVEAQVRAGAFHRAPVGPIGLHVSLLDKKWALPVEALIGKELESFIVKDGHDHDKLRGLMQKHGIRMPVCMMASDTPLNYAGGEPSELLTTAFRVLRIEHPLVLKVLLINTGIERAVFLPDRPAAKEVLRRREHNVEAAFTPHERVFVSGNTHSSMALYSTGKISLIQDGSSRIRELEAQLADLQASLVPLNRDVAELEERQAGRLAASFAELERCSYELERSIRAKKSQLRQMELEQAVSPDAASSLLQALLEDERESRGKLEGYEGQVAALAASLAAQEAALQLLEVRMQESQEEQAQIRAKQDEILEGLQKAAAFRRNVEKELGLLDRSKDALQAEIEANQAKLARLKAEVAEASSEVSRLGPRPATISNRPRAELERELGRLKTLLEELVRFQPDPDQLLADITELKESLGRSKRLVENETYLLEKMNRSLDQRKHMWNVFRKHIGKISNMEFILMLQARGFQGRLEYDQEGKTLHIRVRPQAQVASDEVMRASRASDDSLDSIAASEQRDIRQLSGGEKSYSTACFLFSLWTAMASPLRALDEFDVFMDQVNRDFVINELIKNARSSKVQFILITPNAIWNSIKDLRGDTKIIPLESPERRAAAAQD